MGINHPPPHNLITGDEAWDALVQKLHTQTHRGVLSASDSLLIHIALVSSIVHHNPEVLRNYLETAQGLGISRHAILTVLKLTTVLGIHSYATAMKAINDPTPLLPTPQNTCDNKAYPIIKALQAQGQFNEDWDAIAKHDPSWLEAFLSMGLAPWQEKILSPKTIELICIAVDASVNHLWSSGVRRHTEIAIKYGATQDEVLEVLRIVSMQGLETLSNTVLMLNKVYSTNSC